MPDIQTEMRRVLSEWNDEQTKLETKTQEQPMTTPAATAGKISSARAAFEFIKAHPACTTVDVASHMLAMGFPMSTSYSAVGSLEKRGDIAREGSALTTVRDSYPTEEEIAAMRLAALKKGRARLAAKRKRAAKLAETKKAKAVEETKEVAPEPAPTYTKADQVLESLNVVEARALYARLEEIFG